MIKKELTTAQYERLIQELTNRNKELESKLEDKEKEQCSCDKNLPQPTFPSQIAVDNPQDNPLFEKLQQYYKEKSVIQRQILRYESEESVVELKRKFKEQAISKLKQLSDSDLNKVSKFKNNILKNKLIKV